MAEHHISCATQNEELLADEKKCFLSVEPTATDAVPTSTPNVNNNSSNIDEMLNGNNDEADSARYTQVIVNALPYSLGEEEFTAIFEQFGPVTESRIIRDMRNGRSKGYGFIYYKHGSDASRAIVGLNGFQLYHRTIRVSYANCGNNHDSAPPALLAIHDAAKEALSSGDSKIALTESMVDDDDDDNNN